MSDTGCMSTGQTRQTIHTVKSAPWLAVAVKAALSLIFSLVAVGSNLTAQVVSAPEVAITDSGRVTVTILHDSIPQRMVLLRVGNVVTRTDSTGKGALTLRPGTHMLTATRLGLRADSIAFSLRAGLDTSITLALQSVEIASLIISATRSERRIEDDPLRVEVLEQEEVDEKLRMTPGDISMMLNESSGLRVQTTSPSLGGASVRVQGLRGRYTQLLSDGLPLYGGQTGALGLLQIPPMDLGGVEVIKGVASALYGGSALGGVINLLSRRPTPERTIDLLANQTTLGGTDLVGFASGPIAPLWGFTTLIGAHRQVVVDKDDDGWVDVPGYNRLVVRPRAFWSHPSGHSAMLTVGSTIEQRNGGTRDGAVTPDGTFYPERLRTRRFDAGGVGRWLIGSTFISVRGSASSQQHKHVFGPSEERDQHLTWFSEVAATHTRGSSVSVLGVALEQERYVNDDLPAFDYTFTTPGLFAQSTLDLTRHFSITFSGRADDHSAYGMQFAPRLSSLVRLGESWTLRSSVGAGYFAPTPFTEETEVTGLRPLRPLAGLNEERARSGSMDIGGEIGAVELNATAFASRISDPIGVRSSTTIANQIQLVNVEGQTRTSGGELLVRWNPEPIHITASYTYVRSTEEDPNTRLRREVPLTPRHQVGIVGAWEEENRSRVGVELYYTGRQSLEDNPYRTVSKPYLHVGTMVDRRFGMVRVFANAENLLNFRQTNFDPLVLPTKGNGRWTTDVWGPLEGRVANFGVRIDTR